MEQVETPTPRNAGIPEPNARTGDWRGEGERPTDGRFAELKDHYDLLVGDGSRRHKALPGQVSDLAAAPVLLEGLRFGALIGDKAFDAD